MTLGLRRLTILLVSGAVAAPATVVPIAADARPSGSARKPLVGGRHVSKSENQAGAPERTARQQVVRANERTVLGAADQRASLAPRRRRQQQREG